MSKTREQIERECRREYDATHHWQVQPLPVRYPPIREPNPIRYPMPFPPGTGGIKPPPVYSAKDLTTLAGLGCGCEDKPQQPIEVDSHASLEIDPLLKWGLLIGLALLVLKR